jgi:hypothetical protein
MIGGVIHLPDGNPPLFGSNRIDINDLLIKMHYAKRSKISIMNNLERLEKKAKNLITVIKKEYRIK